MESKVKVISFHWSYLSIGNFKGLHLVSLIALNDTSAAILKDGLFKFS